MQLVAPQKDGKTLDIAGDYIAAFWWSRGRTLVSLLPQPRVTPPPQGGRPVRVKCAQPLRDPMGIWLRLAHGPALDLIGFILTAHHGILWVGGFDMDVETKIILMNGQTFKLVCEQCGSLTVALPIEAQPDPCSILKCGRCGSPRGTLQSLRDTSIQADIRHPV